ncbi:hypothetical protein Bca52824_048963 [Brassica carinata]|uniref:Uncharacterized protein n=1 Tax=Brassica carinata TaxID=52824 RepID=A0A8X7RPJ6_BRACI|nr:hypothetical protein Bca52824_048963 [Brassica carinata]
MEKVCEELDEVKAANEKLRGIFRAKTKLLENLKKLQNKQLIEIQEARSVIEKQGYESEETLMREEKDYYEEDSSEKEEPFDGPWSRKVKDRMSAQNKSARHSGYVVDSGLEFPRQWQPQLTIVEQDRYGKPKSKPKTATLKFPFDKTSVGPYASGCNGLGMTSAYNTSSLARHKYGSHLVLGSEDNMDDDDQDPLFGTGSWRDQDIVVRKKSGFLRLGKKHKFSREGEMNSEHFMGPPYSARQSHSNVAKSSKYANQMKPVKGSLADLRGDFYRHAKYHGDGFSVDPRYISDDVNGKSRKRKSERDSPDTRHGVAAANFFTQFSPWSSSLLNVFFHSQTDHKQFPLVAGLVRNIYFPFDIESDTAISVAREMVEELEMEDRDVTKIANMIDGEIASLVPDWRSGLGFESNFATAPRTGQL